MYAIWNFVDYMAGYAQQDAHEFLIAFLHSLDHQLQCTDLNEKYLFKDVSCSYFSFLKCFNDSILLFGNKIGLFRRSSIQFDVQELWPQQHH